MRRVVADVGDLASIAVPGVGFVALLASLFAAGSGAWVAAVVALVVALLAGLATWWPRRRVSVPGPSDGVRLLAVNLWYCNPDMVAAARAVLEHRPDVVVVSELSAATHEVLAASFPHHELLRVGGATGHGVYSRFPLVRVPGVPVRGQVVWVRVEAPRVFTLCAAHLLRPTVFAGPSDGTARVGVCRAEVRGLAAAVAAMPDVVVAGDLNLSDRQPGYRALIRGRLDAVRTGRARSTFKARPSHAYWRLFAMRIDHLVVPRGWSVGDARVVPISGSDHRAVVATIAPPA